MPLPAQAGSTRHAENVSGDKKTPTLEVSVMLSPRANGPQNLVCRGQTTKGFWGFWLSMNLCASSYGLPRSAQPPRSKLKSFERSYDALDPKPVTDTLWAPWHPLTPGDTFLVKLSRVSHTAVASSCGLPRGQDDLNLGAHDGRDPTSVTREIFAGVDVPARRWNSAPLCVRR